ncbi:MAG: glycerol-3-phosphate 1-O-acyltransferase PlsY [Lachnospiraceae bacterium]|nr:glycerol-3-phosphate 1-O-acyltransferase PlsY [Lachnospiraceae bacterium]
MIIRFISIIIGYLFGMIHNALIAGRLKGIDIREHGSGNSGTTNALRVLGTKMGIVVFLLDAAKAAIACLIVWLIFRSDDIALTHVYMCYAALGAVIGHCFPFYMGFKGGKGVAETFGAMLVIDWRMALIAFALFIVIVAFTRYVSLGSIIAASFFFLEWIIFKALGWMWLDGKCYMECLAIVGVIALIIIVKHRSNIKRLLAGNENKFGHRVDPGSKGVSRMAVPVLVFALIAGLAGCGGVESTSPADTDTDTSVVTEASEQDTAPSSEAVPEAEPMIRIATGTITGHLSTPYAEEEGDVLIASLITPTLYTYDRSGVLLTDASAGVTRPFEGKDYTYRSLADITSEYDQVSDISTFTLKLSPDGKFSNGTSITSDDLIFTYYFLCDDSYSGPYSLANENIIGIRAYQLNNSQAPFINITSENVSDALDSPSEELRTLINTQIIRPIIEEGRTFCEDNWQRYVERGYGNSAQELFVMLFPTALQSDYSGEGKTFDEVVEETVTLFGMNYKAIARIYYGSVEYLDQDVNALVRKHLYEKQLATMGGVEVPAIEGITRVDGWTVSVRVLGRGDSLMKKICDIPVLSMSYYGDAASYDYENSSFGLTRGDVSKIKSHSGSPLGYGPYVFDSIENGVVRLKPNTSYTLGQVPTADLSFINVVMADRIQEMQLGHIDFASIKMTAEENDLIREVNSRAAGGSVISSIYVNDSSYEYFGLNASLLASGEDKGLALRTALAVLISAEKEKAVSDNLGVAGRVINYPGSSSSYLIPAYGSDSYKEFFVLPKDRDILDYARELFSAAGYTFDEEGRAKGDDTHKTSFKIAIPSYEIDDHVMMEIFEGFESSMSELGFEVNPTYFEQLDEFIIALSGKSYDIWMAERSTSSLSPETFYATGGRSNFYGISDEAIDALFASIASGEKTADEGYPEVYGLVMNDVIEVPVYQRQVADIYNPSRVSVDPDASLTEFYSVFDDPGVLSLNIAQ